MSLCRPVLLAAVLTLAGPAQAAGVGVRIGTIGIGADVGFALSESLTLRAGYAGLSVSREFDEDDARYDAEVKLSNLSALIDWRFWRQLRITAGVVHAKNTADLVGRPTGGTFTINDVDYAAGEIERLSGSARLGKSVTPYLGIGYGDITRPGFTFYLDLGVMFQGTPEVELSVRCGTTARCAALREDVAREERELREDIDKLKYYPVFNLGFAYAW